MRPCRSLLATLVLAGWGGDRLAGASDKGAYSLSNPTPAAQLRELSTDRPDQTESAYTVDAGHFQLEMDVLKYTSDRDQSAGGEVRSEELSVAAVNLKLGLLNDVDLQFVFDPYVDVRTQDQVTGASTRASGVGEFATRMKINLWGNDGGATACAIMPYIKWPLPRSAVRNGCTEAGIIVPFAASLAGGWSLGTTSVVGFVCDDADGYETEFIQTIAFGHDLTERLGTYMEFVAVMSRADGFMWQGQVDLGFTYALADAIQLDFGCNFGVTESAPDYQPFVGLSRRF